jgi:hypothetical protein
MLGFVPNDYNPESDPRFYDSTEWLSRLSHQKNTHNPSINQQIG